MLKQKMVRLFNRLLNFIDYLNVGGFPIIARDICAFEKENIYNMRRTLELISERELSLTRFGDGEIDHCIYPHKDTQWQKSSYELSAYLDEILLNGNEKLLTCIPSVNSYDRWWKRYWINHWFIFKNKLDLNKVYGNSLITRPEFFLTYRELGVKLWKNIWNSKEVIFITGENSRFQFDHVIFDNIADYEIVYSKNRNAFDDIDRLIDIVSAQDNKHKIFVIALGQAGTILSYKLHLLGFRSLDVGHIDRSYDNVFLSGKIPEKIKYKL